MLTVHTVCTDNLPTGPLAPVLGLVCLSLRDLGTQMIMAVQSVVSIALLGVRQWKA